METDPASLDPELRTAKLAAIASAAFGLISLCGGIIPLCGGIASGLGVVLGLMSLKAERSKTAMVGIGISVLGMLISIVYTFILMFNQ
jgi:hypothetical protein